MQVQMTGGAMVIDLFAKAKTQIMLKHPFFATLTGFLPTVERPGAWFDALGCPRTACVDGKRIYYYRGFCESLKGRQKIGLLIHEALHCALGHLWRRGNRDPRLWNYACDFAANAIILNATITVKEGSRTVERKAFELPDGALYDPKYEGMAAEQIYDLLKQEQDESGQDYQPGSGQGQMDGHIEKPLRGESDDDEDGQAGGGQGQGKGEKSDEDGDAKGKGKGKGEKDGQGQAGGQGDGEGEGDESEGQGQGQGDGEGETQGGHTDLTTDDFDEKIENEWKQRLEQAAVAAKQRGNLPGNLKRLVEEVNDPRVPWQQVIDSKLTETSRNDYDMQRMDRRFIEQGIYYPDLYSEECSIEVYFDVSGSIGKGEMMAMLGETKGIAECRGVRNLRIMACDTRVTFDETVGPYDELPTELPGGGGTSLIPPFQRRMDEPSDYRTALIIYFTDLEAGKSHPPIELAPDVPVIWLYLKPKYGPSSWKSEPLFGTVIEYDPMTDDPYGQA